MCLLQFALLEKALLNVREHFDFELISLLSNEKFMIKGALIVSDFVDYENTLPHRVNTSSLVHFRGVEIPVLQERNSVDLIIE